jgi:urate oxidase
VCGNLGNAFFDKLENSIVKDTTKEKNRIKSLLRFHEVVIPDELTRLLHKQLVQAFFGMAA